MQLLLCRALKKPAAVSWAMESVFTLVPPPGKTSTVLWIPVVLVLLISLVGVLVGLAKEEDGCATRGLTRGDGLIL